MVFLFLTNRHVRDTTSKIGKRGSPALASSTLNSFHRTYMKYTISWPKKCYSAISKISMCKVCLQSSFESKVIFFQTYQ